MVRRVKVSPVVRLSVPRQSASSATPSNGHSSPSDVIRVPGTGANTLTDRPADAFQVPPGGKTGSNVPKSVTIDTRADNRSAPPTPSRGTAAAKSSR